MNRTIFALSISLIATTVSANSFVFNNFTSTNGLQLNNNAAIATDSNARQVLRVSPALGSQAGSAFSTTPISLNSDLSFSTKFAFNFNNQFNGGADGLVFALQTVSNTAGSIGGGIGYQGITNSIGIEFDNWDNGWSDGYSDNHVGIDLNGNINSVALTASPFFLDSAQDLFAWVDYNGNADLLEVRLNNVDVRPTASLLSYTVDLTQALGSSNAYAGFTSATGWAGANHDVISWEFRDSYAPVDSNVPEPAFWALVSLGFISMGIVNRKYNDARVNAI